MKNQTVDLFNQSQRFDFILIGNKKLPTQS